MNIFFNEEDLSWIDKLAEQDYLIIDDFFNEKELIEIDTLFNYQIEDEKLIKAGVGAINYKIVDDVRGDFIYWLNESRDTTFINFFNRIKEITYLLNRYCYLSISGNEFHLALYPKGAFYTKHIDQFKDRKNRLISIIFYLNENWKPGDGGELKIYKEQEIIVPPIYNRLVMFKSDSIEHEVLVTNVNRKSITGWLLYQPAGLGFLS